MGALPGTHKSQFPLSGLEAVISAADDMPPYGRSVTVPKGSAIIFTEAMTHATSVPFSSDNKYRLLTRSVLVGCRGTGRVRARRSSTSTAR